VKLAHAARAAEAEGQEAAAGLPSEMGLDVVHTQHELQRVLHRKWKQAERQLEAAAKADDQVAQATQYGRDARGVARQAWGAWCKAERLVDEAGTGRRGRPADQDGSGIVSAGGQSQCSAVGASATA
jgi:hypothetical protein